jgi:hypothetical protein
VVAGLGSCAGQWLSGSGSRHGRGAAINGMILFLTLAGTEAPPEGGLPGPGSGDWCAAAVRDGATAGTAEVGEGDVIRIFGWKHGEYGAKDRLSTVDLIVDGTAPDATLVLAGLVPIGFGGAAAVRLSNGRKFGLVTSRSFSDHRAFDETNVVPLAKLPSAFR